MTVFSLRHKRRKDRSVGHSSGGPFLGHRTAFRQQFTGTVSGLNGPCNVLQTFYCCRRTTDRVHKGGNRGATQTISTGRTLCPNVWTCVPLRSRLLLSYSMHVCPLKMLFQRSRHAFPFCHRLDTRS